MHQNIAMKFEGYMASILLCKYCKFSDKIYYNPRDIKLFLGDYFLLVYPVYCQRQNCSPGILVSSKVRFMWIFVGVCWRVERVRQMRLGSS